MILIDWLTKHPILLIPSGEKFIFEVKLLIFFDFDFSLKVIQF